jgi:hypothetical protein
VVPDVNVKPVLWPGGGPAIEPWMVKPSMVTLLAWTVKTLEVSKPEVSPGSTTDSAPLRPGTGLVLLAPSRCCR